MGRLAIIFGLLFFMAVLHQNGWLKAQTAKESSEPARAQVSAQASGPPAAGAIATLPQAEEVFPPLPVDPAGVIYQARELRTKLAARNFAAAEKIVADAMAENKMGRGGGHYGTLVLKMAFDEILHDQATALQPVIDEWVRASAGKPHPLLVRGSFHTEVAWVHRGGGWSRDVTKEGRNGFQEHLTRAAEDLKQAMKLDPKCPVGACLLITVVAPSQRDPSEMMEFFAIATRILPEYQQPYMKVTNFLAERWSGQPDASLEFAREAAGKFPDSSIPYAVILAHKLRAPTGKGRERTAYFKDPEVWKEIQKTSDRLLERWPRSGLFPSEYAQLADTIGDKVLARKMHDLAVEREPDNAGVRFERAHFLSYSVNEEDLALKEFEAVLALEPTRADAWVDRALILLARNDFIKAARSAEAASKWGPRKRRNHSVLGEALMKLGDYFGAIRAFDRAVEVDPDEHDLSNRAYCKSTVGQYQEALKDVEKILSMDPTNSFALQLKAQLRPYSGR